MELRGWIEAGERVVALLAPRGPSRRRALEALAAALEGRFAIVPWSGAARRPARPAVGKAGGPAPTLLVVEEGETLGAEGARVLHALAHEPSRERRIAVALAPEEAGPVLRGLGPELEIVTLRPDPGERSAARQRWLAAAAGLAALILAGGSLGLALGLVLPRLAPSPAAPARASLAPPPVGAPPPEAEAAASPPEAPRAPAEPRRPPRARPPPAPSPSPAAAPSPPPRAAVGEADGWLIVNAIPRAWIDLDGAALGETPIVRRPVPGGPHRVRARFESGREQERSIRVAGREVYLMFDGRPSGAPPQ
jgi:hypothetical protein